MTATIIPSAALRPETPTFPADQRIAPTVVLPPEDQPAPNQDPLSATEAGGASIVKRPPAPASQTGPATKPTPRRPARNGSQSAPAPELAPAAPAAEPVAPARATDEAVSAQAPGNLNAPAIDLQPAKIPGRRSTGGKVYGYVNGQGQWVIEPRFEAANPFSPEGTAWVMVGQNYAQIDKNGKYVIKPFPAPQEVGEFAGGALAPAKVSGDHWGFINRQGQWVIEPRFSGAKSFGVFPLAPAANDSFRWGYVDSSGKFIVRPSYSSTDPFMDTGLGLITTDEGHVGLVDQSGQVIIKPNLAQIDPPSPDGFSRGEMANGGVGLIGPDGRWVIEPVLKNLIGPFNQGLYRAVVENDLVGIVNNQGQWVIEPRFLDIGALSQGLAPARDENGLYGYLDPKGTFVILPKFLAAYPFGTGGLARVVDQNGLTGYIEMTGTFVIQPAFDYALDFNVGHKAPARQNGKWGLIGLDGRWEVTPRFSALMAFVPNDLARAQIESQQNQANFENQAFDGPGAFDLANLDLADLGLSQNEVARAQLDGKWGFVDESGNFIVKPTLKQARDFPYRGPARAQDDSGSWGLIGAKGEWLAKPIYLSITEYSPQGLARVVTNQDNRYGFVDTTGAFVIDPIYAKCDEIRRDGLIQCQRERSDPAMLYFDLKGRSRVPIAYDGALERPDPPKINAPKAQESKPADPKKTTQAK
ncbi:MAG: WG repeat-containing protein [Deltaproteobacteria bacterium]|nr:WG repeat-containing protein [Deltaproteobacteria bacterium]